ncbi:general secretion pathway protein GspE [Leptolyngbya sp. 'hensonii']|nr:general secretion pathway protein GspE [Leptolyngbya sp. 'hensonii']
MHSWQSPWTRLRSDQITCEEALSLLVDPQGNLSLEQLDDEVSYRFFREFEDRKSLPSVIPLLLWHGVFYLASPQEISAEEICRLSARTLTGIEIIPITSRSYLNWLFHQNASNSDQVTLEPFVNPLTGEEEQSHLEEITDKYLAQAFDQSHRIQALISIALQHRASDIHLEPTLEGLRVRYRIDGMMRTIKILPGDVGRKIVVALKVMSNMNIAESRKPQDGRIGQHYVTSERIHFNLDMRTSTYPSAEGEKMVIRLLPHNRVLNNNLELLGFTPRALATYHKWLQQPQGLILVTGPTGSGKTTTLYTTLNVLATDKVNVVTLEDPIECKFSHITQGQINETGGMSFASGLRAILRQDPDIIMVGEIRDAETAETAIQAALTGHFVLSTIHTNSAVGAIPRLRDLGVNPSAMGEALLGVLAQRLVRKVCKFCAQSYTPEPEELATIGLTPETCTHYQWQRGQGCDQCFFSGYLGRDALIELVAIDDQVRALMLRGEYTTLINHFKQADYDSFYRAGLEKIAAGATTIEEVLRVLGYG